MKIEGWLFGAGAIFYLLVTALYGWLSQDWTIGVPLLLFTGFLALIVGYYVLFTAKRVYPRPEDRQDGEIDEADPEYGFYSPHSWWPLAVGFSAFMVGLGFIFANWLFLFGVLAVVVSAAGWLFEYYVGPHAH
jgi:hypothetical protein